MDDDADGREVLTAVLELEGAKVTSVGSVRAALDVLDGMRPDVIVSEIGMPDETGTRSPAASGPGSRSAEVAFP